MSLNKNIIERVRRFYFSINFINCPILDGSLIYFTHHGFKHIFINGKGIPRPINDQIRRFKLLRQYIKYAIQSTKYFEYRSRQVSVRIKRYGKFTYTESTIHYWALISKCADGIPVKVIVRQIGDGRKHFYSIMAN